MYCPRCKEKLERTNSSGIETEKCLYCDGVWAPGESLRLLLKKEPKAPSLESLKKVANGGASEVSELACPECSDESLGKVASFGVELDYCANCNGIYFDAGELKAVLPTVHKQRYEPGVGAYLASESVFFVLASAIFGGKC